MTGVVEVERPAAASEASEIRHAGLRRSTVYAAIFAVGGATIGIRRLHDNSFMWHLRTGRLILDHGIPHTDPYSFTAHGASWVAQSWLAELAYGVADRAGGAFGVRLLGAALGLVVGLLLFVIAYRAYENRARATGLATLAFGCVLNVWSERPLMFGLVGMLVLVLVCEFPDTWIARRPMIVIPVTMWLWANSHGTFAVGFGYLALHLFGQWLDGHSPAGGRERQLLQAGAAAAAVTLVNPYGLSLVLFPVKLMLHGNVLADVQEWQSPNFRQLGGQLFGALLICALVVYARKRPTRRDVLISAVFLGLGLWAIRNVGLAAVVVLPIAARNLRGGKAPTDHPGRVNVVAFAAVVVLAFAMTANAASQTNWQLDRYPVAAVKSLHDRHLLGHRLLTTDAWGGYLVASAWPEQQVFFDDRYDMYPIAINDAYRTILDLRPGWKQTLDQYDIDVVMWPANGAIIQMLSERSDWVEVYRDKTAVVMMRRRALPNGTPSH